MRPKQLSGIQKKHQLKIANPDQWVPLANFSLNDYKCLLTWLIVVVQPDLVRYGKTSDCRKYWEICPPLVFHEKQCPHGPPFVTLVNSLLTQKVLANDQYSVLPTFALNLSCGQ